MHVEEKAQRISLFVIDVNRMIVENKGIIMCQHLKDTKSSTL